MLAVYVSTRIATHNSVGNRSAFQKDEKAARFSLDQIQAKAKTDGRRQAQSVQLGLLMQSLSLALALADDQTSALGWHLPTVIITLVLIVALAASVLLGHMYGLLRRPYWFLSFFFCASVSWGNVHHH